MTTDLARTAIVLYCSGLGGDDRAAKMWRHVRGLDRRDHVLEYPALAFPHLYALRGGYAAFVAAGSVTARLCTGAHVREGESLWAEESRACAARQRRAWRLASRATGIAHVVTEARAGAEGAGAEEEEEEEEEEEDGWGGRGGWCCRGAGGAGGVARRLGGGGGGAERVVVRRRGRDDARVSDAWEGRGGEREKHASSV